METKTVTLRDVSTIAMVNRNELKITHVIDEGILKQWVGIGWIDLRKATKKDRAVYPIVVRS